MKVFLLVILCVASISAHPAFKAAKPCNSDCKIENNCRCSSSPNPINNGDDPAPLLIAITVSESLVSDLYSNYLKPLLFERTNPDGGPIGASFYINHQYTDYTLVQDLYLRGFEIGSHSITKNPDQEYWRHASLQDLIDEMGGQRKILATFANIPEEDITGGRTPQLQIEGDVSIEAYTQSGLVYDNSWPESSKNRLLPYTLDYLSTQECSVSTNCPKESHPAFWIAPITNIKGANNSECNSFPTCSVVGTADEIASWLSNQIDIARKGNRAPLNLRLDSYWFNFTNNSFEGFTKFLDAAAALKDVFFVSVSDTLEWIKNPVPLSQYLTPVHNDREADCAAVKCHYSINSTVMYMKSCIPCPPNYPWKGNPLGE